MTFELMCMTLIGLLFGLAVVFGGYRLFLILLPIWGFFFGFGLGAQTLQAIFGVGFLATISSWVLGFIVGAIFAILSYLFYIFAVALLSGSFGYSLAVGILTAIGLNFGLIVWLIGIVAGIALAVIVLAFNIQKYAIIVITALSGTAAIILTLLASVGGLTPAELAGSPVLTAIQDSFLWLVFFVVVAGAGIVVQLRANQAYEIEAYDRFEAYG
jgi:hypothetical protein